MLYSIGYQAITPEHLIEVLDRVGAYVVLDVRGKPFSRKKGFSRKPLEALLGKRYRWVGDILGGPGGGTTVQPEGIEMLAALDKAMKPKESAMLMCLEASPANCHRHQHIAVPLLELHGINVWHILDNEVIDSAEVERWLAAGAIQGAYEWGDLWQED